jgi:trimeric autotransporter adhesin
MLSSVSRRALCALLPLLALAANGQAATTTCVNSAAALQTALTAAQNNDQDDVIQVVAGTYNFAASINVSINDGNALTIEGGYAAGCAAAPTAIPDNTVINGVSGTSMQLSTNGGGLTVRNLTLSGFKPAAGTNAILIADFYGGDMLRLENLNVTGNGVNGINDSILAVRPFGGLVFDDNIVHDNANALAALNIQVTYPGLPIAIANNTVTANAGPGFSMHIYSEVQTVVSNNIFWNNGATDFIVDSDVGNDRPTAFNNIWLNCSGCSFLSQGSANNLNTDPKLTTAVPKYRLGAGSPAINSGIPVPMALPAKDAAANTRTVGSAPDRGAYESATNDLTSHTFLVTSTGDDANNLLTLRGAITAANNAGAPASIHFKYTAGCPQVISISTPLPPITVPMIIDGYSESDSAANTATPGSAGDIPFNATICVIVFGTGSPAPAHALSVASSVDPSVHLEVRGLRIENFQQAIELSGGVGSWIHGNAFAGPFVLNSVVGNGIGVQLDGGFADVVGGPVAADVNLLGASTGTAGVVVTGGSGTIDNQDHIIANNSIGADPTGFTNTGYRNTSNGIVLQNTRLQLISGNWIVANGGDGIVMDNASANLVQSNSIGSDIAPGYGNAGMGVRIRNNSANNWIGPTSPTVAGGGNEINSNGGAGVLVDIDASYYNEITGNVITGNGGLAIDLALLGVTANTGTESTGPNHLLHKPQLTAAAYAAAGMMTVHGTIATSANVNRYVTIYANSACGGEAQVQIGTYIVQADASGLIKLNLSVPAPNFAPANITATEEGYTAGATDTSEISNSRRLKGAEEIFYDTFDCL